MDILEYDKRQKHFLFEYIGQDWFLTANNNRINPKRVYLYHSRCLAAQWPPYRLPARGLRTAPGKLAPRRAPKSQNSAVQK